MDTIIIENATVARKELFGFEEEHNENECQKWMVENWHVGICSATVYYFLIFGIKYYMRDRQRYDLRIPLAVWSGTLAIFSILGTVRMYPKLYDDLFGPGLHFTVCESDCMMHKPSSYWAYIFTLSKLIELGDTVFIVLRKQPLIFLHYYHHITVLLYVWYSYPQRLPTSRLFGLMNFAVHSLMYSYYTLRALKIKIPKTVNIMITAMQLLQMVVGVSITIYTARMLQTDVPCNMNWPNLRWAALMYFSYFLLFAKFFYDAYLKKPSKVTATKPSIDVVDATKTNGHVYTNGIHKSKVE